MSTASPSGPHTQAKISSVLTSNSNSANTDNFESSSDVGITASTATRPDSTPTAVAPDVESPIFDSVLEDTVSFRLDDTHTDFPTLQLLKKVASSTAPGAAPGVLTLDPPAACGPLDGVFYDIAKRSLDIALSASLLLLLSPLLLITAVLIKLTDGGSIFYPHTRVGEGGSEFTCFKFRSMVVNAEKMKANLAFFNSHDDHRTFKIPDDPRVTWIGRFMRRTSIDELPQLLNVLRGEMSIVGPRPPVVTEVEQYTWDDMQRLTVKPGLTCIWQVSGRSRLPFPEQLKMDVEYIENRSLALDLKLIVLTIPAVVSADGAY